MVWKGLSKKEIYERVIKKLYFFRMGESGHFFENIDHFFGIASKYADEVLEMIKEYEKGSIPFETDVGADSRGRNRDGKAKRETLLEALGLQDVADNK